jgi:vesicle transport through interaction with t-SNAREs protein 1
VESSGGKGRHIEALLAQASELIKQMNVEVRSHDLATRKVLTDKVGTYSKSLTQLRGDYERAKETSQRSELIGDKSTADRQRLLHTNDKCE